MMLPGLEVYVPTVGQAVRALRSVCDGAVQRDDVGFNQSDAPFGRKLAQIPEDQWSAGQRYRAWRMLAKYQAQLLRLGVHYDQVPVPDRPAQEEHERAVFVDESGCFRLVFEYGLMLGEAYRLLRPFWVKDAGNHRCEATRAAAKGVRILAEQYEFAVSAPALAKVAEIEEAAKRAPAGTITRTEGGYLVQYEFDLVKNVAVSEIPSARWRRELKGFYVPAESKAIEGLLVFNERFKPHWEPGLEEQARAIVAGASVTIEASKATDAALEVSGLGGTLRPFQKAGVAYALQTKRMFFADEMGLGKTVESLATLQAAQAFPALVVCPASVKLNWVRETLIWLPQRRVTWLNGGAGELFTIEHNGRLLTAAANDLKADVVVVNYDLLPDRISKQGKILMTGRVHALLEIQWKSIIADEFHYVKSPKALRSEAVKKIILVASPSWRLFLSGTPFLNRPAESLHPLALLDRLDALGGWGYFTRRYCNAYKDRFGWNLSGAAHLGELNERLRALCYIRRTKAEVLTELPEKTWSILPCEITNRKEYDEAQADVIRWIGERALKDDVFLAEIRHLNPKDQQAARHRRMEDAEERAARAEILVRIGVLKRVAAQGKREAARSWVEDFLETGKKLVVFAYHKEEQSALLEAFKSANPARIFGEDSAGARDAAVQKFQTEDSCRLMVASLRAGREGITLHAASDVLFVEQGWTPSEHRQAEDRLHRIGQRDAVTCWYLLARNTIDEDIRDLIEKKRFVVDTATEGGDVVGADSILGELCARLLKKGGK